MKKESSFKEGMHISCTSFKSTLVESKQVMFLVSIKTCVAGHGVDLGGFGGGELGERKVGGLVKPPKFKKRETL